MLMVTKGNAPPETIEAIERADALIEKSGNVTQLRNWVMSRSLIAFEAGNLPAAIALADQALELALREGSPTGLGLVHVLQLSTRYWRGDLAGVEKHFTAGLKFFDDPGFRQYPGAAAGVAFGMASWNAWLQGRTDVAREREAQMKATVNGNNPYHLAWSEYYAARLRIFMREYEQAEASAARALELSEKHRFLYAAAGSRSVLGQARAQLGRATEGIALIREGIAGLLEAGARGSISHYIASLAAAQERGGAIVDALETVEQALEANPDALVYRPETLRLRGELRLKQGQTEPAEADFREAIALAQKMDGKAWELRTIMSLACLLDRTGRRDEARTMLAEIYNWFTEGFDTADLRDAKALLDELGA
jgi:tetratricopeptide (TPR) repeat protein